jgi:short-subunit dehydrogenase
VIASERCSFVISIGSAMMCVSATRVGTTRTVEGGTELHKLADENPGRVEVETVDICEPKQIGALRARLSGREFDILFVNAGTANANPKQSARYPPRTSSA